MIIGFLCSVFDCALIHYHELAFELRGGSDCSRRDLAFVIQPLMGFRSLPLGENFPLWVVEYRFDFLAPEFPA